MDAKLPGPSRDPRVLYVCYEYPVLTQTFTVSEVAGLLDAGLPVTVVSCRPSRANLPARRGVPVLVLPRPLSPAAVLSFLRYCVRRPLRTAGLLVTIATARYRDQGFRCWVRGFGQLLWGAWLARWSCTGAGPVHFHAQFIDAASTVAFVAARLTGATFSVTNHTAYNPYLAGVKLDHAAAFFSISDFDRAHLLALAGRRDVPALRVIRQGIDTAAFAGDREVLAAPPVRILTVSALKEKKGQDVLLRALAEVRRRGVDARLTIVGDGPLRSELGELAERLGIRDRVEFAGAEPLEAVAARLKTADLFALACREAANGDLDGIPVSLMEAMAAGVPVVSTRLSGIPELIEDGAEGRLALPGDPESLAAALLATIADPETARAMAARAREKVRRRHELAVQVGELCDVFRELLAGEGPAR
jgi:glycosyltransferase involved in cell wall biosynthesis